MKDNGINVIEKFVSYQGEGADTGMRMLILRFKDCSRLRPCPFCDTIGKMKSVEPFFVSFEEIQNIVDTEKCGIMITGGEPTKCGNYNQTLDLINAIDCNIFNVESNEELHDIMMSLPLYPYMKVEVTPLLRHPSSVRSDDS